MLGKYRKESRESRRFLDFESVLSLVFFFFLNFLTVSDVEKHSGTIDIPAPPSFELLFWLQLFHPPAAVFSQSCLLHTFAPAWWSFQLSSSPHWLQPFIPAEKIWQMGCVT